MKNNWTISFGSPHISNIDISTYVESVKNLIKKEREADQTVVLHTDDEIQSKYEASIVAVVDQKIIWNSSIYPTHMKPLDDLIIDGKRIRVWESWSVIIHPDFRGKWLGKQLTSVSLETFTHHYDIIVGATVNDIMYTLRMHQGFERIPFPKELYEEGKKYLAQYMKGGEVEFEARAKCMLYNIKLSEKTKNALITLLQK